MYFKSKVTIDYNVKKCFTRTNFYITELLILMDSALNSIKIYDILRRLIQFPKMCSYNYNEWCHLRNQRIPIYNDPIGKGLLNLRLFNSYEGVLKSNNSGSKIEPSGKPQIV